MSKPQHRSAPDPNLKGWPGGIPFIVGNEAAERFSYYGMKAMLIPYLTTLYVATGLTNDLAGKSAAHDVHMFNAAVYALPMVGAIVADRLLGKYRTIIALSLVYCLGHLLLSLFGDSLHGVQVGLAFIALGAGGIKPCVSAHVGDQFGRSNWHLTKKVFQVFYFAVNFGSFFATLLMPWMLAKYGHEIAFGLPGVLMFIATAVFWSGRHRFIHVPGKPGGKLGILDAASGTLLFVGVLGVWLYGPQFGLSMMWRAIIGFSSLAGGLGLFAYRQRIAPDDGFLAVLWTTLTRGKERTRAELGEEAYDGMLAVFRVISVIIFVVGFWALFDQKDTTWVLQATKMDRTFTLPLVGSFTLLPAQTASANPILVLILIPLFITVVFPALERMGLKITPIGRMAFGMMLVAFSFVLTAWLQIRIDSGETVHFAWQLVAYVILTTAEILVSATGLEFAYSQAPRRMKSTVMAFFYLTVTFANVFVALVLEATKDKPLVGQFWFFAEVMAIIGVLFVIRVKFYKSREYAQE